MRYILLVLGVVSLAAGVLGAVRHDYGGIPFIVIGVAAIALALWRRSPPV